MDNVEFGKILRKMREDSGKSVQEVSEYLTSLGYKAKTVTVYGWERGISQPNPDPFLAMCRFYGVSDIFSYFGEPSHSKKDKLSPEEQAHIEKYRALDRHGMETVTAVLECEKKRCDEINLERHAAVQTSETIFNIQTANQSVIGNGNQVSISSHPALQELKARVKADSSADKAELEEILGLLEEMINGKVSFSKGMFSKFSAVMERNPWMASAASETLLAWMTK